LFVSTAIVHSRKISNFGTLQIHVRILKALRREFEPDFQLGPFVNRIWSQGEHYNNVGRFVQPVSKSVE